MSRLGHQVRLIPPQYVKPFVKRAKNDRNDAEAISEAASRPTMCMVVVLASIGSVSTPRRKGVNRPGFAGGSTS